jgi:hypothetical protein
MSKSGSSQTSTTSIDPDIKKAYLENLGQAQGVAAALPTRQFADFNPLYQAGEEQLVNTAIAGRGIGTTDAAAEYANQFAQNSMADIGNYMNPYTEQVIKNNLGDIESSRQTAVQQMGEAATRAKAFGGTRQGVAEGATNKAYADKAAQMSADLRMKGFDTSANLMQQDLVRRMAAAGQLGSLGQQQQTMGLEGGRAVMGAGSARQGLSQQELDAMRGIGVEKLGITQGAMSTALPNAGGSTSTPTYTNPLASALGGAGYGFQFGGGTPTGAAIGGILGLLAGR